MTFAKFQIFKFILFADDTNIFCCDSDLNKLIRVINAELEKIHMWFLQIDYH